MRFAIVGAGMAGLLAAIKLRQAGHDDIVVFEKADRVGGTWRENTYPGIACDVPSHVYSYSFAPNPDWSHWFSPGHEIQQYFEQVALDHDLADVIRFGDEVESCAWEAGRWRVTTAAGHTDTFDVVIAATGVLHRPKYPDIEGLESFGGACFHSARWDHTVELDGRGVGVIGTGSTAIQITSALVDRVGHYSLFQRTAQWVLPQPNPTYTQAERDEFRTSPETMAELRARLSAQFGEQFADAVIDADSPMMALVAAKCEANLEDNVADPELLEALRPDYRAACKRLVVSPDFYQAIQHRNASLVTSAIDRVEAGGVRTADGVLHELDVLVLATGFHPDAFMRPMNVTGRGGVTLADAWAERPTAYFSISIPEFPNLFMINGPNGPIGNFSLIEIAELQWNYIEALIEMLASGAASEISATTAATAALDAERVEAARSTVWVTGCDSWYLDDRGVPAVWPFRYERFVDEMATPKLEAFDLR